MSEITWPSEDWNFSHDSIIFGLFSDLTLILILYWGNFLIIFASLDQLFESGAGSTSTSTSLSCLRGYQSTRAPGTVKRAITNFFFTLLWANTARVQKDKPEAIGHFRVTLNLCFKSSPRAKPENDLYAEFIFMWIVSHLDSFCHRGKRQLRNAPQQPTENYSN